MATEDILRVNYLTDRGLFQKTDCKLRTNKLNCETPSFHSLLAHGTITSLEISEDHHIMGMSSDETDCNYLKGCFLVYYINFPYMSIISEH